MSGTGKQVVLITVPSEKEAASIASALVEERLAACVNIIANIRSIYQWEGKMCGDSEVLLIVKTGEAKFDALAARVRQLHSYDVPEIIALPIVEGSEAYLTWMSGVLGG